MGLSLTIPESTQTLFSVQWFAHTGAKPIACHFSPKKLEKDLRIPIARPSGTWTESKVKKNVILEFILIRVDKGK